MSREGVREGELLWSPSPSRVQNAKIRAYMAWLAEQKQLAFAGYAALHAFSVREPGAFWRSIAEYFQVRLHSPAACELSGAMPNAHWFEGASLNYAEHALRRRDEQPALGFAPKRASAPC